MQQRALTNPPTVTAFAESKKFRQLRNSMESKIVARSIDCLIDEVGIVVAKDSKVVEVLMGSLAALLHADRTGTWEAANELVEEEDDLFDGK